MQHVLHHDSVFFALGGGPGDPADEAVDRILLRHVVEGELVVAAVEAVAAVLYPVRPWDQDLSAP
jgi:hypothetical protein